MQPLTPIQLATRTMHRRRKLRKPSKLNFPNIIEAKYRRELSSLVEKMRQAVKNILVPELPGLLSQRGDSQRFDQTIAEKLADLMRAVSLSLEDDFAEEEISRIVSAIGDDLSSFNRMQVHRVFKSVLGVDLLSSEPNMQELLASFVGENVSLIKSVEAKYLSEVQQVVLRGVRGGLRHEEIASQLIGKNEEGVVSRAGKAESSADLIARDQTNKLYGQLTEERQTAAGIDKYIWRTALDERVRPEHAEREGEEFSWNDPPDDGHPGEAINCRCYAEPVIEIEGS